MNGLFYDMGNFNEDINSWDISNVESMNYMFFKCTNFNKPLNNWDVSKVENMDSMFFFNVLILIKTLVIGMFQKLKT